jgi:hypothetical protein
MAGEGRTVALTTCYLHGGVFEAAPEHVVTAYVDNTGHVVEGPIRPGVEQVDICDPCIIEVNKARAARGLDPHETAAEHAARWGDMPWAGPQ